jgi:short-subunit dehydrogenase
MSFFNNKVVIVTGSSSGIGKSLAFKLGEQGAKVVINSRGGEKLEQVAAEMSGKGFDVLAVPANVGKLDECRQLVETTLKHYGRIDVLINNAGANMHGRVEDTDPEVLHLPLEINYLSALYMTKFCLPALKESKGGVMFVSSLAGIHGLPINAVYSSAKMGLRALAECLKAELTGTGVYVGIAYVGITENEQGKTIYNGRGEKFVRPDFKMLGMQSIADVADDILWMIRTRRFKHVFTFPGKLQAFLNSFAPGLVQYLLTKAYLRRYNNGW